MSDESEIELALIIETGEPALEGELRDVLGEAGDVSASRNFTGGTEIAVFFNYAVTALTSLFGFLNTRQANVTKATLKVGPKSFEVSNMSPDELRGLIGSPEFLAALKAAKH